MKSIYFPVKLKLQIDWSDLDYFGHVNNVSIFKDIQSSRVKYLDKIGLTKLHQETKTQPILASFKCDFKWPFLFPGQIIIQSRSNFIKNTSFGISYQITDDKNQISAEAEDIIVVYDFDKNKKRHIPQSIHIQIEKLESKTI